VKNVKEISTDVKERFVRNVKKPNKKLFFFLISVTIFFAILFIVISPIDLIENIGIQNIYLIAFFVSLFGSLSAIGSITFISLIVSLVSNGVSPLILGLICGAALTIGDIFLFTAFSEGRRLVKKGWDTKIQKFSVLLLNHPVFSYAIPFFSYIYISFIPLPNDILLAFLAAIDYPKKRVYAMLLFGDLTFAFLLTFTVFYGMLSF